METFEEKDNNERKRKSLETTEELHSIKTEISKKQKDHFEYDLSEYEMKQNLAFVPLINGEIRRHCRIIAEVEDHVYNEHITWRNVRNNINSSSSMQALAKKCLLPKNHNMVPLSGPRAGLRDLIDKEHTDIISTVNNGNINKDNTLIAFNERQLRFEHSNNNNRIGADIYTGHWTLEEITDIADALKALISEAGNAIHLISNLRKRKQNIDFDDTNKIAKLDLDSINHTINNLSFDPNSYLNNFEFRVYILFE